MEYFRMSLIYWKIHQILFVYRYVFFFFFYLSWITFMTWKQADFYIIKLFLLSHFGTRNRRTVDFGSFLTKLKQNSQLNKYVKASTNLKIFFQRSAVVRNANMSNWKNFFFRWLII